MLPPPKQMLLGCCTQLAEFPISWSCQQRLQTRRKTEKDQLSRCTCGSGFFNQPFVISLLENAFFTGYSHYFTRNLLNVNNLVNKC